MSEQKFYKQVPVTKPWYETYERGSTFIEATYEDLEKAGWVKREKCVWYTETDNNNEPYYETACGEAFCFIVGNPKNNNMKFCPYCGSELIWKE